MKLRNKLLAGFLAVAFIIFLAGITGIISSSILGKGIEEIEIKTEQSNFLDQKLNDHYVWMQGVTDQFLLNHEFDKQLDPKQCGFGKWYYEYIKSDEYKSLSPEVRRIIDDLEAPHKHLHETGAEVKNHFSPVDIELGKFLVEKKVDHLNWMNSLRNTWEDNDEVFTSTTDPTQCGFGKWYYGFMTSEDYKKLPNNIKSEFQAIEDPHRKLHESADDIMAIAGPDKKITDEAEKKTAKNIFYTVTEAQADMVMLHFDNILTYINSENDKKLEAIELYKNEMNSDVAEIVAGFKKFQTHIDGEVEASKLDLKSTESNTRTIIIFAIIFGIAIAVLIGFYISNNISRPINNLANASKRVGEGDLRIECDKNILKSDDEIGLLARSFTQMVDNLKVLVSNITSNANTTASTSEELSASSEETNASTEQVSATVQEIAKGGQVLSNSANTSKQATEELISSINAVANSSEESVRKANEARDIAKKGGESAKLAGQKMKSISQVVNSSSEQIQELGVKTQEINKIIEVINSISEQTNLLALNAAIEAARAGEAGKGFAVVADEVRKLAEESKSATKQIENMVENIMASTKTSVDAMKKGTMEVEEGSAVVNQALNSLELITSKIEGVASDIQNINASTKMQLASSEKVKKAINEVSAVAEQSAASTEQVSASIEEITGSVQQVAISAQNMAKAAEDLKSLIHQFKVV